MNWPFWCIRAGIYFSVWLILAFFLCRWSRQEDRVRQDRIRQSSAALWLNGISGFGLVFYGISMHFASVDWIISLQPEYHSTITGPLFASQQALIAFSMAIITLTLARKRPPLVDFMSTKVFNDIGTLLVTFVILWSYMWWFEFMLTWIANLPADDVWYVDRVRGGWLVLTIALALFGFVVPFLLLLQRTIKQRPVALRRIAVVLLWVQVAFVHWQILPAFRPETIAKCWMSLVAPLALGGVWLAVFVWCLRRAPLLGPNDKNALTATRMQLSDQWEAQFEESLVHG